MRFCIKYNFVPVHLWVCIYLTRYVELHGECTDMAILMRPNRIQQMERLKTFSRGCS